MNRSTDSDIDAAIVAVAETYWKKVAMIVAKAADRLGGDLPAGDEGHLLVAKHIETLVSDGRLLAQGDITQWRHSEVRLPES